MKEIYDDINLTCRDCDAGFVFSVLEQKRFQSMGYLPPKRCKDCRKKRRQRKEEKKSLMLVYQKKLEQAEREQRKAQEIERFNMLLEDFNVIHIASIPADEEGRLFIIGNGFDLMHGVRSNYYDFQATLGKHNSLRYNLEMYLDVDDIWADFEEALGHLNTGMMLNDTIIDMWLDNFGVYDPDAQAADFFVATEAVTAPATEITRELPRRFRMWVEGLTANTKDRPLKNLITNSKVLCFNYTEFIEQLYGVSKSNVCYIHGCRRKEKYHPKGELILGHKPGSREEKWHIEMDESNFKDPYKRYMAKAAYETASQYLTWYDEATTKNCVEIIKAHRVFFDSLRQIESIVVVGHSISEVDWEYFEEINRVCDRAHWYVGCHGFRALNNFKMLMDKLNITTDKVSVFKT